MSKLTKAERAARDRRIIERRMKGDRSADIGRDEEVSETRVKQICNFARQRCHYWRNRASSRNHPELRLIRAIEKLPLEQQRDIHRWIETRAPR